MMLTDSLTRLFFRDLDALKDEIKAYADESTMWEVTKDISNSAGNLCLHLIGNLNHFIGHDLGNTDYVRQRDLEFSQKNVPRDQMIQMIDALKPIIENTLNKLTSEDLNKEFKRRVFEAPMTTEYFLIHLSMHLAYHLGQINYHRRLLDR